MSTLTTHVLVAVVSLVVGFIFGMEADDLIDQPIGKEGRTVKDRLNRLRETPGRARRTPLSYWLLGVLLLVNAVNGIGLITTRLSTSDLAECVAAYNQQFSQAYQARFDSAATASKALDRLVIAVAANNRTEFKASIDAYVTARQAAIADQKANPYPELPDTFCGEELKK